eukprot:m.176058 g.176058  ORF g.176058 m.176058 type:complete len:420 (+) comp31841_c1_seq5:89-1348(+)
MEGRCTLFSRVPAAGNTKTRLIPELGATGAARVQLIMSNHMLEVLAALPTSMTRCIGYHGDDGAATRWLESRRPALGNKIAYAKQRGNDLGDIIANAISDGFTDGDKKVAVIGADIPSICEQDITTAMEYLVDCDMVLGPAADGGYYLVAVREEVTSRVAITELFSANAIAWGTESVFEEQVRHAIALGLSVKTLPVTRSDIDTPPELTEFQRVFGVEAASAIKAALSIVVVVGLEDEHTTKAEVVDAVRKVTTTAGNKVNEPPANLQVIICTCAKTSLLLTTEDFNTTTTMMPPMTVVNSELENASASFLNTVVKQHVTGSQLLFVGVGGTLPLGYASAIDECLWTPGCGVGVLNTKNTDSATIRNNTNEKMDLLFLKRATFDKIGGFGSDVSNTDVINKVVSSGIGDYCDLAVPSRS